MRISIRAALALSATLALALAVLPAHRDAAVRAAGPPPFDDFNHRDYWYWDDLTGADTFPLDRTYSNAGATLEPSESATCVPTVASVWMEWHGDRDGTLTINARGDGLRAVVAVYELDPGGNFIPSPPGGNLISLACGAATSSGSTATVTLAAVRDRPHYIQVGSIGGTGDIRVTASCACRPPNDDTDWSWNHAIHLDAWQPLARRTFDTTRATLQPGEPRPCGNINGTAWLEVSAENTDRIRLSLRGAHADAVLAVYTGDPSTFQLDLAGCADATDAGGTETLALDSANYTLYYVQVGTRGGGGKLELDAACDPACRPYNDDIGRVDWHNDVPTGLYDITTGATVEPGEPRPCGNIGATVWYQVIARGDTRITVDVSADDFDAVLAAYSAAAFSPPPASLSVLACDAGTADNPPNIAFDAAANVPYWIQVGGRDGATGGVDITIDCDPSPCPPRADNRVDARLTCWVDVAYGLPWRTAADTTNATTEPGEPLDCGNIGRTVWVPVDWSRPGATVRVSSEGSGFDAAIAVYDAPEFESPLADYRGIACADGGGADPTELRFVAPASNTLWIQVGGRDGAGGPLQIVRVSHRAEHRLLDTDRRAKRRNGWAAVAGVELHQ